jgi:hypothetical protein
MPVTSRLMSLAAFVIVTLPAAASAQWLEYPTAGVPRTADGRPNLTAPAPRTTDGEPDLSGMWGWETARCALQRFSDLREFINIAATLKEPLPYRPGVAERVTERTAAQDEDPNAPHGGVDDHAQTTAGSGQRAARLQLPREREALGAHGEDEEVNERGIQRW